MLNDNPVTEDMIRDMAREARNGIRRIFLHWTVGHYGHNEEAYHICIDRDGTVYLNCKSFLSFKAHTWMHNTGAIGIALLCGYDAHCWTPAGKDASLLDVAYENDHMARTDCAVIDYGEEPPTRKQIDVMAKIVALLCRELCLPLPLWTATAPATATRTCAGTCGFCRSPTPWAAPCTPAACCCGLRRSIIWILRKKHNYLLYAVI